MRFKDSFELEAEEASEDVGEEEHPEVLPETNAVDAGVWGY